MLRIMCFGLSDPQWPSRMQRLCREYGGEVVYWTSMQKGASEVATTFPDAIFHNMAQAIRGVEHAGLVNRSDFHFEPPGDEILKAMEPYQATAMKLMERMDPDQRSFSYEERLRHYYRQLRYWLSVLKYLKPDLVFFPITPHANYDYIAYGLCRSLGIETLLLDRTAIPSRVLVGRSIEETADKLSETYRKLLDGYRDDAVILPTILEEYYRRMQGDYAQALPLNVRRKIERTGLDNYSSGRENPLLCIRYELAGLYRHVRGGSNKLPDNYLKEKQRTPEASECGFYRDAFTRMRAGWIKHGLRRYYEIHQRRPDLSQPYVFVPLHYQPERSSVPAGEWFGDQYLMIDMLSKTVPQGWRIYVKEHSQQWSYFAKGERGRSKAFYEDLLKLDNVSFVPVGTSPFDLIDHARVTATVAGSAGWESVVRGKPALVFGHAWYRDCEGCYRVGSADECATSLRAIANAKIDAQKVRLFLKALDEAAIHTVIDTLREDYGDLTTTSMIDHFVKGIGAYLQGKNRVTKLRAGSL